MVIDIKKKRLNFLVGGGQACPGMFELDRYILFQVYFTYIQWKRIKCVYLGILDI